MSDHQDGRYFVDNSIEFLRMPVAGRRRNPGRSATACRAPPTSPAPARAWRAARARRTSRRSQASHKPEHPGRDHRRIDDRPQQPALHHLEGFRLPRARLGLAVIDEQPRQIEHAGHPGDDRDDVQGLHPLRTWRVSVLPAQPRLQHLLDMRDRRLRQDAVAEIEDERPAGERLQYRIDGAVERLAAGQQRQRIEIALHRPAALDAARARIKIDHPVEADRIDRRSSST